MYNIFKAIRKDNLEQVKEILEKQPMELETKNTEEETPLAYAVGEDKPEIVKFLIEKKANLEAHTSDNLTILEKSVSYLDEKIVELLLKNGTKVTSKCFSTVLQELTTDIAKDVNEKKEILKLLFQYGEAKLFQTPYTEAIKDAPLMLKLHKNGATQGFIIHLFYSAKTAENLCIDNYNLEEFQKALDTNSIEIKGKKVFELNINEILIPKLEILAEKNYKIIQNIVNNIDRLKNPPEELDILKNQFKQKITEIYTSAEIIENHLTKLFNRLDSEKFSIIPYSNLKNIILESLDTEEPTNARNAVKVYEDNPQYKPENYFKFLINPDNSEKALEIILENYDILYEFIEDILKLTLDLPEEEIANLGKFKKLLKEHCPNKETYAGKALIKLAEENNILKENLKTIAKTAEPERNEGKEEEPLDKDSNNQWQKRVTNSNDGPNTKKSKTII
ncbi:MAG: ankyrin repeat domain-containing protein [Alphaproteobacteria bacterium]